MKSLFWANELLKLKDLVPTFALHDMNVGVRLRIAHDARPARAAGIERGGIGPFAEERLGKLQGESALAEAFGPDEQVRGGQPPGGQRTAELLDDGVVTAKALPHGVLRGAGFGKRNCRAPDSSQEGVRYGCGKLILSPTHDAAKERRDSGGRSYNWRSEVLAAGGSRRVASTAAFRRRLLFIDSVHA
jgi:hypothetical protein